MHIYSRQVDTRKGLLALSPLLILIVFIVVFTMYSVNKDDTAPDISLTLAFMASSIFAIISSKGMPVSKRIETYSRGAGEGNLMLMLWIYILAGVFAASAKGMGSIDATVSTVVNYLPSNMLLPGLFMATCFISLSIGTSVGTIVALVPIAVGIASSTGFSIPITTAVIVGGAYFGDNLSFISDTTVVATQTQQCQLNDKFKANFMIVLPAAVLILIVYAFMGADIQAPATEKAVNWIKVLPYLAVLITAIAGMNVMAVLTLGIILCGIIGICNGDYTITTWASTMGKGINDMGELIIIAMMAGGMLGIIKANGGIDFIIGKITAHVKGKRGAELSIAALVSMVNLCTANNTVAILTVGNIAKNIGDKYGVDNRKAASILDTFSCFVQGLIPYSVQILLASGLSGVSPTDIIPYLFYPMAIGVSATLAILFRLPKKYS